MKEGGKERRTDRQMDMERGRQNSVICKVFMCVIWEAETQRKSSKLLLYPQTFTMAGAEDRGHNTVQAPHVGGRNPITQPPPLPPGPRGQGLLGYRFYHYKVKCLFTVLSNSWHWTPNINFYAHLKSVITLFFQLHSLFIIWKPTASEFVNI